MSTRKLAKELGLLRRRGQSSHGKQRAVLSNQIFSYLIVIDFESTCWRERNAYSQEIIEFPAVLLNTSTGAVESEFHTYVQPQEHPVLSEFCTELTGITQMQVEGGIPLHICLSRFARWLQNLQLNLGVTFPSQHTSSAPAASQKPCTFLTWSDWDLGVCLQYECKRKQLHKPAELNSWIDLRSTYRMFYNKKPRGLNGALQDLGIQFEGREHSGLDDSRNTAQLAARMMRDGCVMKITKSLARTSSVAKPTSRHPAADKKGGKCDTSGKLLAAASSSSRPETSGLTRTCVSTSVGTKQCQSLVRPKTLLNVLTAASPLGSCPLQRNSVRTHHLIPSSTTFTCLPRQSPLNQPAQTAAAEYLSLETDERCGSYDDVLLEDGHDVAFEAEGPSDSAYAEFDEGCSEREEPKNTRFLEGFATSERSRTTSFEGTVIHQSTIRDSFTLPRKVIGRNVGARRPSLTSGPCPFGSVAPHGRRNTGLDASVKLAAIQTTPLNVSVPVKNTPSFKVLSENPSRWPSGGPPRAPTGPLRSRSVNALCTRGGKVAQSVVQRVTSPLCSCGRRARRQLVSNGGPNHGRGFYCCPRRRSAGGGQAQSKGCDFFRWESAVMESSSLASPAAKSSSVSFCHVLKSSRSVCPAHSSLQRKSF